MRPELKNLIEDLVVEELCKDDILFKSASSGMISTIVDKVKEYIMRSFDPEKPTESIMAMATPTFFRMIPGLGAIGWLFWIAQTFFHLDLKPAFTAILAPIREMISSHKAGETIDMTSDKATNIASGIVDSVMSGFSSGSVEGLSSDDVMQKLQMIKSLPKITSARHDNALENVKAVKILMAKIDTYDIIIKEAGPFRMRGYGKTAIIAGLLYAMKDKVLPIVGNVLSFILRTILTTTAFTIAGGAAQDVFGLEHDEYSRKPSNQSGNTDSGTSSSTNVKVALIPDMSAGREYFGNHNDLWVESFSISNIKSNIVNWAIKIYPALRDHVSDITSSTKFNDVVGKIEDKNAQNRMPNSTLMPDEYHSRKQVVDVFVGEVASKIRKM